MNPIAVIHRIEDLQVVCFAVVFGIMAVQARRNQTFQFLLVSYLLGSAVSVFDVTLKPTPMMSAINLALISLRYGTMAFALAAFVQPRSWFPRVVFAVSGLAMVSAGLVSRGMPMMTAQVMDYGALAAQFALLCALLLSRNEKATRTPRRLLAVLFLISTLIRCCQIVALLRPTPDAVWLRDQLWFINSTLVGCMVPFTIIWMMNARVHSELRKLSIIDPLTGLLNRRGLQQAVVREMARYSRGLQNFAVAVADVDHFKAFNDTHGHSCGDMVLQTFAEVAQTTLRLTDVIARTGGEEFTLLLPITSDGETHAVIDRVRARLAAKDIHLSGDAVVQCTVSIGFTSTMARGEATWQELLKEADTALYQAKRDGRNRTVQFAGSGAEVSDVFSNGLAFAGMNIGDASSTN